MNYIIVPTEHLGLVNFYEVAQTSPESLRYSIDKKHFLLKYKGDQPRFVYEITQAALGLPEYNHTQILEILNSSEWNYHD